MPSRVPSRAGPRPPQIAGRCSAGQRATLMRAYADAYAMARSAARAVASLPAEVASVVLHELLHRDLGVDDQRHGSCRGDRKHRCYRDAGLGLARRGRSDLAVRNIDNYVFLARAAATAGARRSV